MTTSTAVTSTVAVAVGVSVVTSVATTVATTIASSVITTTASAAAGGATGGAAAAAGGAGGAAGSGAVPGGSSGSVSGGSLVPLLLGAQRFALSSGLAVETSDMQSAVANSMRWAKGQFGLVSRSHAERRRRLDGNASANGSQADTFDDEAPWESATRDLHDLFLTAAIALPVALLVQYALVLCWRHCINAEYYREKEKARKEARKVASSSYRVEQRRAGSTTACKAQSFVPLPSPLIFPNLVAAIAGLLLTGFVEASAALLAAAHANGDLNATDAAAGSATCTLVGAYSLPGCLWPPVLVLIAVSSYMLLFLALLLNLYCRHSAKLWQDTPPPESARAVEDPLQRGIERIRTHLCCGCAHAVERSRGAYEPDEAEMREPNRTERLLESPFLLFRSSATDSHASLTMSFAARSRGNSLAGVTYDWLALLVQLIIAALLGIGPSLKAGSPEATGQLAGVMSLQCSLALWLLCAYPPNQALPTLR